LTNASLSGGLTNGWEAPGLTPLGQITNETWHQSGLVTRARGTALNASSVSANLDGGGVVCVKFCKLGLAVTG